MSQSRTRADALSRASHGKTFRCSKKEPRRQWPISRRKRPQFRSGWCWIFSSSMAPRFGQLQQAVAEFLKSPNPQDEFCLIEFRDRAELSMGFTGAPEEIQNRVGSTKPRGDTAVLDAVYLGLRQMRKARNPRKILLIVSDGGDNHSRYRAREVENLARESDVEIYAIGI